MVSRSSLFFYTAGVSLGVIAIFVLLTLILRNFIPKVCNASVTTFIMIHSIACFLTNQTCWMSSMSLSLSMLAWSLLMRLKIKGGGDSFLNTYSRRHVHNCKVLCMNQGCAINYRLINKLAGLG